MIKKNLNQLHVGRYSSDLLILFVINILFIVSALVDIEGNAINYAVTVFICILLFGYLLFVKRIDTLYYQPVTLLFLLFIIILLLFPIIYKHDIYIRLFVLKIILLIFFFKTGNISIENFSKIINLTYMVYLAFSFLAWVKVLPMINPDSINSFVINIGAFNIETLYGISGSTADIDTYSVIIFLWNLFVYRGKYRNLILLFSFIALVLTFRGTPMVTLVTSLVVYVLIRTKLVALLGLLGVMAGLIGIMLLVHFYPENQVFFLSDNINWNAFAWDITHARSALWNNQIILYLNEFSWFNYLYGPDLREMTSYFTRPDGLELEENFNPHNSYLILLYRSTIFFVILYIGFIYYSVVTFHRRYFPIIFAIALAALTNSSLFGLENPLYVLIILYVFINFKQIQNNFSKRRVPL